ncbi:hypothetical protein V1227_18910 [Lentzea sp. DG1S-22]|uniref:hypothetical protein n=1 Tax=Lentzea sp. DG1S-22 TaxID=3108822 RepID=UPI002E7978CC|nr:hypothetical protein [Lentzea sp. DG1S-22]WVH84718.1 hypothetical protein V1227_18910 [Lentzea sp. DG1S-22]
MSMEPFATLEQLKARLDWTLDEDEERLGAAALDDLSGWARYYGRPWPDPLTAPQLVRTMVLGAAVRYMRNPEGYVTSRAGDETLTWSELGDRAGSAHFNSDELRALTSMSGKTSLLTAPVTAWNSRPKPVAGYVPVTGGGKPFPMFSDPESPW